MRVLHIFTNPHFNNGATLFEYRVSEHLKDDGIVFDYLCTEKADNDELKRYKKVGSRVYRLPIDNNHGLIIRELKINRQYYKFFKKHKYDIVYADTENALRSIHLLMARLAGVKVRVVHSHNTGLQTESKSSKLISRFMRRFFVLSATDFFACSTGAAEWLFPAGIIKKKKFKVIKNGIDLARFSYNEEVRGRIRDELGLEDEFVIGNVGRFMPQKNHDFIIEVFNSFHKMNPDSKLLLVGDGPLRASIADRVKELGLESSVIFTGNVSNVNEYYQAMDVFFMPSLFEGLPITGVEAQAAGLPCLLADNITDELKITELIEYMSLDDSIDEWVNKLQSMSTIVRRKRDDEIISSGFSIQNTVDELKSFYMEKCH